MEPSDGFTESHNTIERNNSLAFFQHRNKNISFDDHSFLTSLDSGYGSSYLNTPNTTPTILSSSPPPPPPSQRILTKNTNLGSIEETIEPKTIVDTTKLTPVTANIRKICDFHITTPKTDDFTTMGGGTKRRPIAELNFEDFQSTPKKSRLDNNCIEDILDAPIKALKDDKTKSANSTPRKLKRLRSRKQVAFRQKLKSAPDLDIYFLRENHNDDIENVFTPTKSELSPIHSKNINVLREKRTPLIMTNTNLIQSSTPKSVGYYSPSSNKIKPSSVKKLLSFNDNQYENLYKSDETEDFKDIKHDKNENSLSISDIESNYETKSPSVKKLLSFTDDEFANLIKSGTLDKLETDHLNPKQKIKEKTSQLTTSQKSNLKKLKSVSFQKILDSPTESFISDQINRTNQLKYTKLTEERTNLLKRQPISTKTTNKLQKICESPNKNDFQKNTQTNSYDMEISPLKSPINNHEIVEFIGEHSNYNFKCNLDLQLNTVIECDDLNLLTPTSPEPYEIENYNLKQYKIQLPTTPKKLKTTTSSTSTISSIEHERLEILYPTIPNTPSKKLSTQNCSKRKIDEKQQLNKRCQRKFYDGITQLNIIGKLETYTLVLDRILNLLSDNDLYKMTFVSKSWRRIIRQNYLVNQRLVLYLNKRKHSKENNTIERNNDLLKGDFKSIHNDYCQQPFSQTNGRNERKRCLEMERSPPVSPSKRKFYENQKIVRTLSNNEKLVKCPRCDKSSRIINSSTILNGNDFINNNSNNLLSTINQTFHATSTFYNINNNNSNNNNNNYDIITSSQPPQFENQSQSQYPLIRDRKILIKSISADSAFFGRKFCLTNVGDIVDSNSTTTATGLYRYGECTGILCNYRFCLDCLCEYHPGTKCKVTEPISPSKEDQQNGILQLNSPYSRNNLMSSGTTNSRSIKNVRRKSLKRLCF